MNYVNPFPCLIFLSNLSKIDKVALAANLGKKSLAKGTERSFSTFLLTLPIIIPNVLARNPPD